MALGSNVLQIVINGVNRTSPAFLGVSTDAKRMGLAVSGAFSLAMYRAGEFSNGLAEISTLLDGDTGPAIARMRKELLDLSVQYGQTIGKLTKARYDIISAGFTNAADSAKMLTAANKLAVAGVSNVAATADLLTTAVNGLGLSASDADWAADVLFQTVRKGKTTVDQLAASLGPVFASARVARVGLTEVGAAIATLTANGIDTVEASTALNNLLRSLAAPSGEAKQALDDLGINLDRGLIPALIKLGDVGEGGLEALARFIPNIRALKAAASAAVDVGKLTDNLDAMENAAGEVNSGVAKMEKEFDFAVKRMRASLDAMTIQIGTLFLPTMTSLFDHVRDAAAMIAFLMETVEDGTPRWKAYGKAIAEEVAPYLDALLIPLRAVRAAIADAEKDAAYGQHRERVTAVMKELMASGMDEPFKRKPFAGLIPMGTDLKLLRQYAELVLAARDAATGFVEPQPRTIFDAIGEKASNFAGLVRAALAQVRGDMEAARRLAVPAEEIIQTGFGSSGAGGALGPEAPGFAMPTDKVMRLKKELADVRAEASQATPEVRALLKAIEFEKVQAELRSMKEFTIQDFTSIAFSIGDTFAGMASDVGSTLLGLQEGPILIGRAFKQMAAGIISDITRIIGRMLVAKALMSIFGGGGGVLGSLAGGMMFGGYTPRAAAFGLSVPVGMPSMILPGSPGLDRTLVRARGGELFVPRERVNAAETMLRRTLTAPRTSSGRQRGGGTVDLRVVTNRPFRKTEQLDLRDSVVDGLKRSGRNRV